MHLLLIHQAFVSPHEAGGTRHYELARHFVQRRHQFTIVASDLSYLTGQRFTTSSRLVTKQDLAGVTVFRTYTYPSLHRSFVWRVVSFLSFMFTSIWAALKAGPVDVVMGTSPPIFQAVSAWVVSVLRRRPFLLEIRDLWPAFGIEMGILKNPFLITLSRWLEGFLYARVTHILVNSPAYRDYLLEKHIPEEKISVIPNGVDPHAFDPEAKGLRFRQRWQLDGKFVVTYAGALGIANDLSTLLRAAAQLQDETTIQFLLVGDGKERSNLEKLAHQLQLPNVTFTGSLPKSEMPDVLAASDACIATLQDIPMFRTTYPNKVFDYMAAGRPTILAIDGVIREVVESANGGIFVPPGNAKKMATAIRTLSHNPQRATAMGAAARTYVTEHFNRQDQALQFRSLVQLLVEKQRKDGETSFYRNRGKRFLDLLLTLPAIVIALPVMGLVAFLIYVRLGLPVFFCQPHPGFQGKPFTIYKFRTMRNAFDSEGKPLPDEKRLSPLGRFLRKASLDELPELLNVTKGEMSLVGPRPLLMQYLDRYTPEEMRRHDVKPGITGWAQVNGRNSLSWKEKFALDIWYVNNQSLWLDVKIIISTIWKILKRENINEPGQATAKEFMG